MEIGNIQIGTRMKAIDGFATRFGNVAEIVTGGRFHAIELIVRMDDGSIESVVSVWDQNEFDARKIGWHVINSAAVGVNLYYPEMRQDRPAGAEIDAQLAHYGKHYFIKTALKLAGRGIEFRGTLTAESLTPVAQHKAGWNEYKVTIRAFDALAKIHRIAIEGNL